MSLQVGNYFFILYALREKQNMFPNQSYWFGPDSYSFPCKNNLNTSEFWTGLLCWCLLTLADSAICPLLVKATIYHTFVQCLVPLFPAGPVRKVNPSFLLHHPSHSVDISPPRCNTLQCWWSHPQPAASFCNLGIIFLFCPSNHVKSPTYRRF